MELYRFRSMEEVRGFIKECQEDNHIQQVAYSTYHDALTQVCFDCKRVRTNLDTSQDKGVYIERAGNMTKHGQEAIRAVCGTDEEYTAYVNKYMQEDTLTKNKQFADFKGKRFYPPFKCLCCGKEVDVKQFCYGRTCAYCDMGKCQTGKNHGAPDFYVDIEKGHGRKDIFENAEDIPQDNQAIHNKSQEFVDRIKKSDLYGKKFDNQDAPKGCRKPLSNSFFAHFKCGDSGIFCDDCMKQSKSVQEKEDGKK